MRIATIILSGANIILALMSAIPCLMAGAMGMDSPQAQASVSAHVVCSLMISFPVVCLVCGMVGLLWVNNWGLLVVLWPWLEACAVIGYLYLNDAN